ncbi:MAG: zinc ribbon domain-containing protein [Anaerolineae bacterium]|nr:zinc ribbon domain-containing protein [Anaerolineae bacterium]MCI0607436.1 zinc ribbon domain-containing protein [Anaerolineae bacterium]
MRQWLVFILFWGLMIFPSSADAQGGTQLESVNIELWSEYDQPSMLVIQEFVVAESTTLPAEVSLRFPKNANLIAVAFNRGGKLVNTEFEGPKEHGNWQIVILTVRSRDAHRIEYYQPLTHEEDKRKFSFQWFGDYSVKKFILSAFIPLDSMNIITSPILSSTSRTSNGLYLTGSEGYTKLRMGESYEFQIEYTRESASVTNPTQAADVQASDPVGPDTPGRVSIDKLPWIIGGFGLALIAVILFLFSYWRSMQSNIKSLAPIARSRLSRRRGKENGDVEVHCHECGTRAHTGDRFCRICGSKLRIE